MTQPVSGCKKVRIEGISNIINVFIINISSCFISGSSYSDLKLCIIVARVNIKNIFINSLG